MCPPAGVSIAVRNFDEANRAIAIRQLTKLARGQHGLGLGAGHPARGHRAIFSDNLVGNCFHAFETMMRRQPAGHTPAQGGSHSCP